MARMLVSVSSKCLGEIILTSFCRDHKIYLEEEMKFPGDRMWRADYGLRLVTKKKIVLCVIEVNGGIWSKRRLGHSSGKGLIRDYEKSNAFQCIGYRYLQYTPEQFNYGVFLEDLKKVFGVS